MTSLEESQNPDVLSILLTDVGKKVFSVLDFTKYPEFKAEKIIEYNSRMRLSPLEKFNGPCYISVVNIYADQNNLENENAMGALILYFNEEICSKLLKKLDYSNFDEDKEDDVMRVTGQLMQKYMKSMLISLRALGYSGLITSEPRNYVNSIPEGVSFDYGERELYSASFYAWKKKCIVTDLTLSGLANKK